MADQVKYTPDGKGGYIGGYGVDPAPGLTVNYTPGRRGQVSGAPAVGDPIEYSPDGKGGYLGCTLIGAPAGGLYYWAGRGFLPINWAPYGPVTMDEAFHKRLVSTLYNGTEKPLLRLDEDDVPHIFWWHHTPMGVPTFHHLYLPHPWNEEGDEWDSEVVSFSTPSDRFVVHAAYKWNVRIGTDNTIHVTATVLLVENSRPYLIYFKKDPLTGDWSEPVTLWFDTTGATVFTLVNYSCDLALDLDGLPHISYVDTTTPPYNPSTGMTGAIRVAVLGPGGEWTHEFVRPWRNGLVYPYSLPETVRYYPKIVFKPGTNHRYVVTHTAHRGRGEPYWYNTPWYYENSGLAWTILNETRYATHLQSYNFSVSSWEGGPSVFLFDVWVVLATRYLRYRLYDDPGWYFPIHEDLNRDPGTNDIPCLVNGGGTWDPVLQEVILDYHAAHLLFMTKAADQYGVVQPRKLMYVYRSNLSDSPDPNVPFVAQFYEFPDLETNLIYCDLDRSRKNFQPHFLFLKSA